MIVSSVRIHNILWYNHSIMKRYLKKELHLGTVYLIEAGGLYKLGRSNDLAKRLIEIQVGNGHKITLVCAGRTVYSRQTERLLQKRLKPKRTSGEWFALDPRDVERLALYISTLRPIRTD